MIVIVANRIVRTADGSMGDAPAMGRYIEGLHGRYITGPDMNTGDDYCMDLYRRLFLEACKIWDVGMHFA